MKKTLVLSNSFPPISCASSHVISSIVKYFSKEKTIVLRGSPTRPYDIIDDDFQINIKQYKCDLPDILRKKSFRIGLPVYLDHLWIFLIVLKGLFIIKKEKIEKIFSLFPTHYYIIASYFLHKITGLPLYIYWVDVYAIGRPHFFERLIANFFEEKIFKAATANFVMTDFYKDYYSDKYGIDLQVLPIPTELKSNGYLNKARKDNDNIKIVFTGRIYRAQLDAIQNLIKAVNLVNIPQLKVVLLTPASPDWLKAQGIHGQNLEIYSAKRDGCLKTQRESDILFLPLSFNSAPEVVKLSLPSKVLEYFVAKRPILVHAPADCFISYYAKKEKFGYVVDKPNIELLAKEIKNLLNDKYLEETLVNNAQIVLNKHSAEKVTKIIMNHLS